MWLDMYETIPSDKNMCKILSELQKAKDYHFRNLYLSDYRDGLLTYRFQMKNNKDRLEFLKDFTLALNTTS